MVNCGFHAFGFSRRPCGHTNSLLVDAVAPGGVASDDGNRGREAVNAASQDTQFHPMPALGERGQTSAFTVAPNRTSTPSVHVID